MEPSSPIGGARVLAVGIYLADQPNTAAHVATELAQSRRWSVDQRWVAIGRRADDGPLAQLTVRRIADPIPKFVLLNQLLAEVQLDEYEFLIVTDDDITLPPSFVDEYLSIVTRHDFALAQPARTHDSYIDHAFVEQLDGLAARWTRFVEIGPLFSIRRNAVPLLLPFDERSPMGWGYDLAWPRTLEARSLRLGIVDAVPVTHAIRKPVAGYDHATADRQMQQYLEDRSHLSRTDAFFIVEPYA